MEYPSKKYGVRFSYEGYPDSELDTAAERAAELTPAGSGYGCNGMRDVDWDFDNPKDRDAVSFRLLSFSKKRKRGRVDRYETRPRGRREG